MIAFLALIDSDENKTRFSHLYNKYCRLIYTIAYEKLSSREAAEDTVQDTFLYIAKRMDALDFSDEGRTKNYLATVARGFAISRYNKEHKIFEFVLTMKAHIRQRLSMRANLTFTIQRLSPRL